MSIWISLHRPERVNERQVVLDNNGQQIDLEDINFSDPVSIAKLLEAMWNTAKGVH